MSNGRYLPVRRNGRLLFEYDPGRQLIRIKRGRETCVIDLAEEAVLKPIRKVGREKMVLSGHSAA